MSITFIMRWKMSKDYLYYKSTFLFQNLYKKNIKGKNINTLLEIAKD